MRSDYALYGVGIIFFVITCIVTLYPVEPQQVLVVATVIGGLFFLGLGYTQRPKPEAEIKEKRVPPITSVETIAEKEKPVTVAEIAPLASELTKIKGIGAKRAEQLAAFGIHSIEDLAKASAKNLAKKLKLSPKITKKWIANAKALTEKS